MAGKTSGKTSVKKQAVSKRTSKVSNIRIRLNNVGFGDSFLLTFETISGNKNILVDCGVHYAGINPNVPMATAVGNIIDAVEKNENEESYIDLVICTHRHQDHISGFADKRWAGVAVGEVWMPWTEDPKDKDAIKIKNGQLKMAAALTQSIGMKMRVAALSGLNTDVLDRLSAYAANASGNAEAMKTLHQGFAGDAVRRFFPSKDARKNTFKLDFLPEVTVHVLAPSRDPKVIRKMNPPKAESYLSLVDSVSNVSNLHAFKSFWSTPSDTFESTYPHLTLDKKFKDKLGSDQFDMEQAAATWLDSAVNGTSLVIVFEVGSEYLLFSGDAQWGSWDMMLSDPDTRELLEKTTFYKVGHHGSHNATPVEFVEKVLQKEQFKHAMASVRPVKVWKNIPRAPLIDSLQNLSNNQVCLSYDKKTGGSDFERDSEDEYIELNIQP